MNESRPTTNDPLPRRRDRIVVMGARDDTLSQLAADMVEALARRAAT